MGSLLSNFLTNRALFFDQFDLATKNVVEMASMLQSIVNAEAANAFESTCKQIDKRENIGDDITHKIHLYLNKIMFTPLNRPDIHALASGIDDVADAIHEASGRMYLYSVHEFSPAIQQIANIILKTSREIEKAVSLLRSSKRTDEVGTLCYQIKGYERQAYQVYYHAVADLFADEKNPIKLLKYREILSSLEVTVNKCKNVTDVLNMIAVSK